MTQLKELINGIETANKQREKTPEEQRMLEEIEEVKEELKKL